MTTPIVSQVSALILVPHPAVSPWSALKSVLQRFRFHMWYRKNNARRLKLSHLRPLQERKPQQGLGKSWGHHIDQRATDTRAGSQDEGPHDVTHLGLGWMIRKNDLVTISFPALQFLSDSPSYVLFIPIEIMKQIIFFNNLILNKKNTWDNIFVVNIYKESTSKETVSIKRCISKIWMLKKFNSFGLMSQSQTQMLYRLI